MYALCKKASGSDIIIDLAKEVEQANDVEIERLLKAVLHRHAVLFPDFELAVLCLKKKSDINEQLDEIITLLQKLKPYKTDTNT